MSMTAAVRISPIASDFAPVAEIEAVRRHLSGPRERIESRFLGIGGSLGQCVEIIGQITAVFDRLARTAASQDEADGTRHLEQLARQALALAGSATGTHGDQDGLAHLMKMVSTLRHPVSELEKTVKLIGLVAVSTRINAAHLTGTHEDFAVFTTDIGRLSEHVGRTVKEFASVYGALVTTLAAASSKQTRFEKSHEDTMRQLMQQLDASLLAVDTGRRGVAAESSEMGASFRRITGGIATAVSALQIGDITRQRVEHVEEALDMLLDRLGDASNDRAASPAIVAAVCRLQAAQATDAAEQFDGDVRRLVDTLGHLAADAGTIVEQSGRIHGAVVRESREMAADLVSEVRRACSLIRAGEETREECDRAAGAVVTSLENLLHCVEAVHEIEADMHIVSLNMGFKCARLGAQGQTLNVIAQELRTLTAQTVVHARAAIGGLRAAASFAQSLATREKGDAAAAVEGLETEAIHAIEAQDSVDRDLTETLDVLARDGARAAALLADVASRVTAGDDIRSALRAAVVAIDAIRAQAATAYVGAGGEDIAAAEAAAMAELAGRYTMASERLMHGRFSDPHAGTSTAAAQSSEEDDLDALFL